MDSDLPVRTLAVPAPMGCAFLLNQDAEAVISRIMDNLQRKNISMEQADELLLMFLRLNPGSVLLIKNIRGTA